MDTRIYELAKQAGYKVKTYWTSDDNHKTLAQTEHYMKDDVLEKFAELIVRECGNYLMSDEFIGRSDLDWDIVLNEHFGVK
jgi:formylmethanofuran dehydrogenase subunit A